MATMHTTTGVHHHGHHWEHLTARMLMALWGGGFLLGAVLALLSGPTADGPGWGGALVLTALCLIIATPAAVAWRSELVGGRLLMLVGMLLAIGLPIGQYIGVEHGVMRDMSGNLSPWWVFAVFDVLVALPPTAAGILLLHNRSREHAT